jgi:hypothetical protein
MGSESASLLPALAAHQAWTYTCLNVLRFTMLVLVVGWVRGVGAHVGILFHDAEHDARRQVLADVGGDAEPRFVGKIVYVQSAASFRRLSTTSALAQSRRGAASSARRGSSPLCSTMSVDTHPKALQSSVATLAEGRRVLQFLTLIWAGSIPSSGNEFCCKGPLLWYWTR